MIIPGWRKIMRRAWSVRLIVLAGLLSGCEVILPLFVDAVPRGVFAGLTLIVTPLALIARVMSQQEFRDD